MADVTTCDVGTTLAEPSVGILNYVCQYSFEKNATFVKTATEATIWRPCECFL